MMTIEQSKRLNESYAIAQARLSQQIDQVIWSPHLHAFVIVDINGNVSRLDTRTQEQREFDEAMAELEEWLKQS